MNILILVNPAKNYKPFFFGIAKSLATLGHHIYYAYDTKKTVILTPIPEMDLSENAFFFDEYLKNNLNPSNQNYQFDCTWGEYFYSDFDRFLTHGYNLSRHSDEWIATRKQLDGFFYDIISKHHIDLVVYENVSNSFEYAAYRICKLLNKQYFGLISARIPNRYEIQSSILDDMLADLKASKQTPPQQDELDWYQDYKTNINKIEPDYMKNNALENVGIFNKIDKSLMKKIIHSFMADYHYGVRFDYASGSLVFRLLSSIKTHLSRKINVSLTDKFFIKNNVVDSIKLKEKYYVYPMHYHPESSTSVLAPEYTDEFHNILNIANHLPFGTFLYVKDHRSAKGLNGYAFYKKLSALPNVKFVQANYNIKDLIKHSLGLITVNSTAGFEALFLEKPVYLLGNVFYQDFDNVFKLENFHSLKTVLDTHYVFKENPIDAISYKRLTFAGKLDFNALDYDENKASFDSIAHNIHKKCCLNT